jgi:hypothetical protein
MRQWIRSRLSYANVMVTILAFIVLGGVSYAATGGNFLLGKANTASTQTSLTASPSFAGKALQLTNTSTGAGATALGLNVASGHAPFTVNSGTKVANLNADKLDGIDSTAFKSNAYIDRQDSIQPLNASGATQVASKSLPAGSFVLIAKLLADNDASSAARIDCSLNDPAANQLDFMKLRLAPTNGPNQEFGNISLEGATTLNVPGTVTVQCTQLEDSPPPGITAGFRKLIAIKIDTLHP